MTIPNIRPIYNNNVRIPNVFVPNWQNVERQVDHLVPPVVLNIGNPIINMPGCVKAHQDNQMHVSGLPKDKNLVDQDPDRAMIVCDATIPSYDAMNYEPEQLIITREAPVPVVPSPPDTPQPDVTPPEIPPEDKEIECPAPNQPRVGDLTQKGDERVIGHEIQNGQCVVLYEPTTAIEKFLPSTNQVSTTAAIAVVATASAAATPIILRVLKPVITKLWKTIQKKLGKDVKRLSIAELKTNKYREKKGLPPLKRK